MWFLHLLHRLFVRLFGPRVVAVLEANPDRENYPMGMKLVAVDPWKTQWTIVEGDRGARLNRSGVWYMPYMEMNDSFVFTLEEASAFAEAIVSEGEPGEVADRLRSEKQLTVTEGSTASN